MSEAVAVAGAAIVVVGTSPSCSKVELEALCIVGATMSFSMVMVGVLLAAADASLSWTEPEAAVKLVMVVEDMCMSSLMVDLYEEVRVAFAFSGANLSFVGDERAKRSSVSAML